MTHEAKENFLNAAETSLRRDESGHITLAGDGRRRRVGSIVSAFPLTHPKRLVSVRDDDGQEIGILDDTDALDPASKRVVQEELDRSYFMPRIGDILKIDETLNVVEWEVHTNKGPRVFQVRNVNQNVRRIGQRRFVIKDVDGNRYEIRDWTNLKPQAQKLIQGYL